MRRSLLVVALVAATMLSTGGAALACGGLIGPNGAVNLVRTSTLAAYHDGVEHYVTAFKFFGAGGQFGSIVPLPGIPTNVERGGAWTLQRLLRETNPVPAALQFRTAAAADAAAKEAEVLFTTKIDALDITVLRGGGQAVGLWARERGFRLPPDAPEVLDFYAQRSPIFLAAVFDGAAAAARGQQLGDGTPVHITIPTDNPWVPLRILGLGKAAIERVEADVYLLTDRLPALLPAPGRVVSADRPLTGLRGLVLEHSAPARTRLLDDLRADDGMGWVPRSAWLTKIRIDAAAGELAYDLAIDASGKGAPSRIAAGLEMPKPEVAPEPVADRNWIAIALVGYLIAVLALAGALFRPVMRDAA